MGVMNRVLKLPCSWKLSLCTGREAPYKVSLVKIQIFTLKGRNFSVRFKFKQ